MIRPALQGEEFLADVAAARLRLDVLSIWWLGQSGFLLHWQGRFALLDPYLSDSLSKKYAATDKPHVRMTERVVAPEWLDFVEVVTSSHNHTDHLDAETLQPLVRVNPNLIMVCPEANRVTVRERSGLPDGRIMGLDAAASVDRAEVAGFQFHAVPAAHEDLAVDSSGRHIYLGFVVRAGPWTVYHSGDTVRYPGMAGRLRPFHVDLALLPINGRAPERRVAGNLSGPEAAQLATDLGAGCVLPCHYDMFAFNTASPEEFASACGRLGQKFSVLQQGARWSLP